MKPYQASCKLAVRDSLEDDFSDDVEDDVFIRDGKSSKNHEESGLKRPLMAPRRKKHKATTNNVSSLIKKRAKFWKCCEPFCYGLVALIVLFAVILFAAIILTMFPVPLQKIKVWINNKPTPTNNVDVLSSDYGLFYGEVIPCTQLTVHTTWSKVFSKLNSESPVRKLNINDDDIEDIIIGYGVDDSFQYEDASIPKCFAGSSMKFCEGGLIALDGKTGNILWQKWTAFNVFSLFCSEDLNEDGHQDCVAAGRGGLVIGIDGRNGMSLWNMADISANDFTVDLYTVSAVRDLDDDGVSDIFAVHAEETDTFRASHIKLISGKKGTLIRSIPTPFHEEIFVPIQLLIQNDGTESLLIITGGQMSPGGLYLLRLNSIMKYSKESDYDIIYQNANNGFMVPAILTDITGDSVEDIIIASFNSTVYAFDGVTFKIIWTHTFPVSETVSTIVPGHFNHDNITDFMVKYNSGPGFPIYYYSQTTILNGLTGESLLDKMIKDSGGPNSLLGGISISQTLGGDFFLHWQTQCKGVASDVNEAYQFIPESDMIQQSRADPCKLRYNASTVLKLNAIARHIEPPGAVIFSTDDLVFELNQSETKQQKTIGSAIKHPKMLKKLINKETINENQMNSMAATPTQTQQTQQPQQQQQQLQPQQQPSPPSSPPQTVIQQDQQPIMKSPTLLHAGSLGISANGKKDLSLFTTTKSSAGDVIKKAASDGPVEKTIQYASNHNNNINNMQQLNNVQDTNAITESEFHGILDNNNNFLYPSQMDRLYELERKREEQRKRVEQSIFLQEQQQQQQQQLRQQQRNPEEYENYFNYDPDRNFLPLRSKYPINRDIRSKLDVSDFDEIISGEEENSTINTITSVENVSEKPLVHAETLWDLELEKEMSESAKNTDFNYNSDKVIKRRDTAEEIIQNFLPAISSTGVLVESIDKSPSTVDYIFVLNVRESEAFPPLLLPQDLACIEDKISAYKISGPEILELEKRFLQFCLNSRLSNMPTASPIKFESQIVVTRISITCGCGADLKDGEICAKLNNIENQKWTGYMGNEKNGFYS